MAEELQGLLERIHEQGLKKTDAEREQLLAAARQQADQLLHDANAERDRILAAARQEADKLLQTGEDKLRQAARDVVVGLEADLQRRVAHLVKQCVADTLSPSYLADLILALGTAYAGSKGAVTRIDLLVPEAQLKALDGYLKGRLASAFRDGLTLTPVPGLTAGVQIAFNGESVYHDFTDDAVTEMLCAYANPRLVALLGTTKG